MDRKETEVAEEGHLMCRNIRPLFNYDPPVTDEDVRASALQFVRKISGFTKPSQLNTEAFENAVDEVTRAAERPAGLARDACTAAEPRGIDSESEGARRDMQHNEPASMRIRG